MFYTGIGSRETPAHILLLMTEAAAILESRGWTLRSGAADGADAAFEAGVISAKEIYLPWAGFNNSDSPLTDAPTAAALEMAAGFHPAWERCSQGAQKMHARNCHQVLGQDLKTPSTFVVCWTEGGRLKGGTAQAIRIAQHYGIPVYNLGKPETLAEFKAVIAHMLAQ